MLRDRGLDLVVCEGGPHLLGGLAEAGLLDELFLTVAPQLGGRYPGDAAAGPRGRCRLRVGDAPWGRLVSVMRADSHLFLRYRMNEPAPGSEVAAVP